MRTGLFSKTLINWKKPLNSLSKGNKKSVMILPDEQLEALLDKLSGFVKDGERILILARYHHLRPEVLQKRRRGGQS